MTEHEELLEDAYDGIRLCDHPVPGWWVALFWATIIFSVLYWLYFEWGDGASVYDEYNDEALAYYDLQARLYGHIEITNDNIAAYLDQPQALKNGQTLYAKHCQSCHGLDGGGDIGPNLTDEYWIHGGELVDIYESISEGISGNGMQAWKTKLNPVFMMQISAYVRSLAGSAPPGAKGAEGARFEPPKRAPVTADPDDE